MVDGDVVSAQVVTQRTITERKHDGSTVTKQVWESLDTPKEKLTAVEKKVQKGLRSSSSLFTNRQIYCLLPEQKNLK